MPPDGVKHTPAPWLREGLTVYVADRVGRLKGKDLFRNRWWAQVHGDGGPPAEEVEAVAKLMAAAPDLLAACEAVAEQECTCADDEAGGFELPCLACRCERAVFKALGREDDRAT